MKAYSEAELDKAAEKLELYASILMQGTKDCRKLQPPVGAVLDQLWDKIEDFKNQYTDPE